MDVAGSGRSEGKISGMRRATISASSLMETDRGGTMLNASARTGDSMALVNARLHRARAGTVGPVAGALDRDRVMSKRLLDEYGEHRVAAHPRAERCPETSEITGTPLSLS